MPKENNKMQVDIDTLKKQNVNDLLSIKELYIRIEELGEKTTQIKYIDNTLVKKIKKEYNNLKKIILDENIQFKLSNDIETINSQQVKLNNNIKTINSQLDTKANKDVIETINSQMDNISFYKSPQMFGAKGDGITDDTKAIQDCMNYCYDNKKTMFIPKATYIIRDIINIPSINIIGDNAILKINEQKTKREHTFVANNSVFNIDGITFYSNTQCSSLGLLDCSDSIIKNCKFEVPKGISHNGYLDLYTGNKNIRIENCLFNDLADTVGGGFWIRDVYSTKSYNIRVVNCTFNHNTTDEAITIYAQGLSKAGELSDVIVDGCTFNILNGINTPAYAITLGNTAHTKDITINNCVFNCERVRISVIGAKINTSKESSTKNIKVNNCIINAKNQVETGLGVISSTDSNVLKITNTVVNLDNTFTKPLGWNCDFENCKTNSYNQGFNNCNVINTTHTQIGGVVLKDGKIIKGNNFILTNPIGLYQRSSTSKENVLIKDNIITSNALFSGDGVYSNNKTDVTFEVASNIGIGRVVINGSTSLVHDNIMDFTQSSQTATQFYNNVIKGIFKATDRI